jgi:hypothetical protein
VRDGMEAITFEKQEGENEKKKEKKENTEWKK